MKTKIESKPIHRVGNFPSFPLRSFVAGTVLLATTAFSPADITLKGNIGARVIKDDVIIARGTTCVLNGTTIEGDVRVLSGAKLYANGAWVDGTVYAYRAMLVDLREGSRVTWNIRANRTNSVRVRGDSQVGGHMRLTNSLASDSVDILLLRNAAIVGDVVVRSGKGNVRVMHNVIEGKLKLVENEGEKFAIRYNEVWDNLGFLRNMGQGVIIENTVGGDLVTRGNTPTALVKRNDVREETVN